MIKLYLHSLVLHMIFYNGSAIVGSQHVLRCDLHTYSPHIRFMFERYWMWSKQFAIVLLRNFAEERSKKKTKCEWCSEREKYSWTQMKNNIQKITIFCGILFALEAIRIIHMMAILAPTPAPPTIQHHSFTYWGSCWRTNYKYDKFLCSFRKMVKTKITTAAPLRERLLNAQLRSVPCVIHIPHFSITFACAFQIVSFNCCFLYRQ